jgi:hypothetical protein
MGLKGKKFYRLSRKSTLRVKEVNIVNPALNCLTYNLFVSGCGLIAYPERGIAG